MTDRERLADILERIDRILRATREGRNVFLTSDVIQDAVIRNLEVIGEATNALTPASRRGIRGVPWRDMAGFRDLAIHPYGSILADEVWKFVAKDLVEIRRAIARARPAGSGGRAPRKRVS